jgi:hypothetical protein
MFSGNAASVFRGCIFYLLHHKKAAIIRCFGYLGYYRAY